MDDLIPSNSHPVLILGGGIHGAAVARDLVLNGVPVILVDASDLATGATAKSSRLIHGGLRYLEYGDVRLVRESLHERQVLLTIAPHLVRPLRLFVPTRKRWGGMLRSMLGFLKLERTRIGRRLLGRRGRRVPRGYWPIRLGLWMYDVFSWGDSLPRSASMPVTHADDATPQIAGHTYRWLCGYSDAQMLYPERCVLDLLADAEQAARQQGLEFRVLPHASLVWNTESGTPRRATITTPGQSVLSLQPSLIVHCSGAWGDLTLKSIEATTTPLFAGTKGSHLITRHPELLARLKGQGIYAETADRRLAFILPFDDSVLVGTTDEQWTGDPASAIASPEEIEYLLGVVHCVFGLTLTRADVLLHYSGVRPLPRTQETTNAAISRDHFVVEHRLHGMTILTLVGGKLTTFRRVAEQLTDSALERFGRRRIATTRDRSLPGSIKYPDNSTRWPDLWQQWARDTSSTAEEVRALWPLYGTRTRQILSDTISNRVPLTDSPFSRGVVEWVIEHEWVTSLSDLVERRLMLVFAPRVTRPLLRELAECLTRVGRLPEDQLDSAVEAAAQRLAVHYGRDVDSGTIANASTGTDLDARSDF